MRSRHYCALKKAPSLSYGLVQYLDDFSESLRDAVVVERNGDLRLIRDDETVSLDGIPGLSDMPVIGGTMRILRTARIP